MPAPKTVLCIMDMVTVGRASLAVALPALAACGVQCCPLPASLFSSHTGGFSSVHTMDTGVYAQETLARCRAEGIVFDAVYIGYLRGQEQLAAARRALLDCPGAYKVVDPALGDGGCAYSGIDGATIAGMAQLCKMADLITPNVTECALLNGAVPGSVPTREELERQAGNLINENASILVTGVPLPDTNAGGDGSIAVAGREAGGDFFSFSTQRLPQDYPGTGDLFTASVLGLLLAGYSLPCAARKAAVFVGGAVRATFEGGGEARMGLWFEPCLPFLAQAAAPQGGCP